jgi:sugar phosphate isomerase/epimerase
MPGRRPTLAVSTGPLWRLRLEDSFSAIKAAGAEAVEILVTQDEDTQSPNRLESLASRHDLQVVALHAPLLLLTRRVFTKDPLVKIRRTLELTRALGVRTIVLHPPYLWQVKYSLWLLHELEDTMSGTGTTITMENMYPLSFGTRRLGFQRFLALGSLGRFRHITLDTSHLAVAGEDIVAAYRELADRVVHVHLSDNRGKGRDSHAPLGSGILPITQFLRELDVNVVRNLVLEVNPGAAAGDRAKLESMIGSCLDVVRRDLPATAIPKA